MKGIGQQDLADVLGVSYQSVSKWETGATMPDISLLPNFTRQRINFRIQNMLQILSLQISIPLNLTRDMI